MAAILGLRLSHTWAAKLIQFGLCVFLVWPSSPYFVQMEHSGEYD